LRTDFGEGFGDCCDERFDGSGGDLSQQGFEFSEELFDGVEVWAVQGQVAQIGASYYSAGATWMRPYAILIRCWNPLPDHGSVNGFMESLMKFGRRHALTGKVERGVDRYRRHSRRLGEKVLFTVGKVY
jgi:hypothetical protein